MGSNLFLSIPILSLAVALQVSISPQIRILGGAPDLVLLIVLCWSVNSQFDESMTWAFVGGIVADLLSAAPLGTTSMGLILIVFIVHLFQQRLYRVGFLLLLPMVLAGTLLKETLFAIVLAFVGLGSNYGTMFFYVIVPTALYNAAAIWVIYFFVRRIQKRLPREKRVFY